MQTHLQKVAIVGKNENGIYLRRKWRKAKLKLNQLKLEELRYGSGRLVKLKLEE